MPGYRYRFVLIEDSAPLPVLHGRRGGPHGARHRGRRSGPGLGPEAQGAFPPGPRPTVDPLVAIIDAFLALGRRGAGEQAWAVPLAGNPLGFLLDSIGDAVLLREAGGRLLYRNRAAEDLGPSEEIDRMMGRPPVPAETVRLGARAYERRCLVVDRAQGRFVLEVLRDVSGASS